MLDWFVSAWNDFWHVQWLLRLAWIAGAAIIGAAIAFFAFIAALFRGPNSRR